MKIQGTLHFMFYFSNIDVTVLKCFIHFIIAMIVIISITTIVIIIIIIIVT